MTNPSLGFGVSELTAALRQQRPRRDIATLPVVNSVSSLQEAASAASAAGSSPGMTSPFAAMAHSPHENADGAVADETAFEAEQGRLEGAQQLAVDADTAGLQSSSFGSDQHADTAQHQAGNMQPNSEAGTISVQDGAASSERDVDVQSASSSDSRQSHRKKGRPKCVLM